jgi:hypothetical protein
VASSGVAFVTGFMNISQLVQKLKGDTRIQHGDLISLLRFKGGEGRLEGGDNYPVFLAFFTRR